MITSPLGVIVSIWNSIQFFRVQIIKILYLAQVLKRNIGHWLIYSAKLQWIYSLLHEVSFNHLSRPILWCDNIETIDLMANPMFQARTKHIKVEFHLV